MFKKIVNIFTMAYLITKESCLSFLKNKDFDAAASLAYYGFFAFIPIFFIITAFFSAYIFSSRIVIEGLEHLLSRAFPYSVNVIIKEIESLSEYKAVVSIFGFFALFWSITPLTTALRTTFEKTFNVNRETLFLKDTFIGMFITSIIITLFGVLLGSEILFTAFEDTLFEQTVISDFIDLAIPVIITFFMMLLFYFIFCPVKLRISQLVAGSMVASVFWIVIKETFSFFLINSPDYGFAFGSLKAIFIIIMWAYFSFAVVLFGAEVMANLREKEVLVLRSLFMKPFHPHRIPQSALAPFIKSYEEGAVIYREGDESDVMYYIIKGSVEVFKNSRSISLLKEGEYFGETSMLLREPRLTTVIVSGKRTYLALISSERLETILSGNPSIAVSMLKEITRRVKLIGQLTASDNPFLR